MTIEKQWNLFEELVAPEDGSVARIAFFTGYASALALAERFEECQAVMDALGDGKCG